MAVNVYFERGDKYALLTRNEILSWANNILKTNFQLLGHLSTGAAYCQLMDVLFPDSINLSLVKYEPSTAYEAVQNFQVLQASFQVMSVDWIIPIEEIVTERFYDSIIFAQRFKKFFDANYKDRIYDAIAVRRGAIIAPRSYLTTEIPELQRSGSGSRCVPETRTTSEVKPLNATVETLEIQVPDESREKQNPETSVEQLQIIQDIELTGKMQNNVLIPSSVIEPKNSRDSQQKDVCSSNTSNKQNPETSVEQLQIIEDIKLNGKMQKNILNLSWWIDFGNSIDSQPKDVSLLNSSNKLNPETSVEQLQIIKDIELTGKIQDNVLIPSYVIGPKNPMDSQPKDVSLQKSSKKMNPETSVKELYINEHFECAGKSEMTVLVPSSMIETTNSMDTQQKDVSLPKTSSKQNLETSVEQPQIIEDIELTGTMKNNVLVPSSGIKPKNLMDTQQKDVSFSNSSNEQNPEISVEQLQVNDEIKGTAKMQKNINRSWWIDFENSMDSQPKDVPLPKQNPETSVEQLQIIEDIELTGKIKNNVLIPSRVTGPKNSMDSQPKDVSLPKSSNKLNPERSVEQLYINEHFECTGKSEMNVLVPSSVIKPKNPMDTQQKDVSLSKTSNKQNPETSVEKLRINYDIKSTAKMQKNILNRSWWIDYENSMDSQPKDVSLPKQNPKTSVKQLQIIEDIDLTEKMQNNVLVPSRGIENKISMNCQQKDVSLPKSSNKQNVFKFSARVNKKCKVSKTQIKKSHQAELQKNIDDMQLQRDFYHSKCLRLEVRCGDPKGITPNKVLQDILFSTQDRLGPPDKASSIYQ